MFNCASVGPTGKQRGFVVSKNINKNGAVPLIRMPCSGFPELELAIKIPFRIILELAITMKPPLGP